MAFFMLLAASHQDKSFISLPKVMKVLAPCMYVHYASYFSIFLDNTVSALLSISEDAQFFSMNAAAR